MEYLPTLRTTRLILRHFEMADAEAFFAIFSDSRVTEYYDCDTFTSMQEAEDLVTANIRCNRAERETALRWAICLESTPETAIGSCGVHTIDRNSHSFHIGYELHPNYWGKGYAFEAVEKMLDFCFTSNVPIHVNRVAATTNLESHRSIALLNRLGFCQEGILRQAGFWKNQYHDLRLFSILRQDWQSKYNTTAYRDQ